jgi:hypothetical protein
MFLSNIQKIVVRNSAEIQPAEGRILRVARGHQLFVLNASDGETFDVFNFSAVNADK